jgi:hypothetical protein
VSLELFAAKFGSSSLILRHMVIELNKLGVRVYANNWDITWDAQEIVAPLKLHNSM